MIKRFGPIAPGEEVVLTFPFADDLPTGVTLLDPTAASTVDAGTDPAAAGLVKSAQTVGTDVLVAVADQVVDVDYLIAVTVPTSNPAITLILAGILPCRAAKVC